MGTVNQPTVVRQLTLYFISGLHTLASQVSSLPACEDLIRGVT